MRETVTVRDADLDRRVARLELRLIEREAQLDELRSRLEDTRGEVVRTMAKLQTLASRAEAASAMAEAEVALQSLRSAAGQQQPSEVAEATKLVRQSAVEFNRQNFGGALYLATQAKSVAASGRARLDGTASATVGGNRGAPRPGESSLALPIRVKVVSRGNVREGPGTNFTVAYSVDAGHTLTAHSFTDDWIRVTDDTGRSGWIFRTLIIRP